MLLGWRSVPVDNSSLSEMVIATEPVHRQVFIGCPSSILDQDDFERRLYLARKVVSNAIQQAYKGRDIGHYTVSLSSRTLVYKGMFLSYQLRAYYKDLSDKRFVSAMALVHQRFSTNTFPSWKLAHPYRFVAHNGEINTLRGNVNWMAAREASVSSPLYGADISKLWPISYEGQSDTACFDNALEFLVMGGYSLTACRHDADPRSVGRQPADGPQAARLLRVSRLPHGAVGRPRRHGLLGRTPDRRHARPQRLAARTLLRHPATTSSSCPRRRACCRRPRRTIVQKWRLQPGKMLLIDLEKGRIISDEELKSEIAASNPYESWLKRTQILVSDLPLASERAAAKKTNVGLLDLQQAFGYTQESLNLLMKPMAESGQEAVGSMGTDTPISALSSRSKLLHTYFKQNFAQVTNPPIELDPRGARHEPRLLHRAAAQHPRSGRHLAPEAARGVPADPDQ